jgi:hypothetical protein
VGPMWRDSYSQAFPTFLANVRPRGYGAGMNRLPDEERQTTDPQHTCNRCGNDKRYCTCDR